MRSVLLWILISLTIVFCSSVFAGEFGNPPPPPYIQVPIYTTAGTGHYMIYPANRRGEPVGYKQGVAGDFRTYCQGKAVFQNRDSYGNYIYRCYP